MTATESARTNYVRFKEPYHGYITKLCNVIDTGSTVTIVTTSDHLMEPSEVAFLFDDGSQPFITEEILEAFCLEVNKTPQEVLPELLLKAIDEENWEIPFSIFISSWLEDEYVLVYIETGAEGLRSVWGYTCATNNQMEYIEINLNDIYDSVLRLGSKCSKI